MSLEEEGREEVKKKTRWNGNGREGRSEVWELDMQRGRNTVDRSSASGGRR